MFFWFHKWLWPISASTLKAYNVNIPHCCYILVFQHFSPLKKKKKEKVWTAQWNYVKQDLSKSPHTFYAFQVSCNFCTLVGCDQFCQRSTRWSVLLRGKLAEIHDPVTEEWESHRLRHMSHAAHAGLLLIHHCRKVCAVPPTCVQYVSRLKRNQILAYDALKASWGSVWNSVF